MNTQIRCAQVICTALLVSGMRPAAQNAPRLHTVESRHAALIEQAFEDWKSGRSDITDLFTPACTWTIASTRPVTGSHADRSAFLNEAMGVVTARLVTPIVPHIKRIVAQGDHVVVLWDAWTISEDGRRMENSYAWHLQMQQGRITQITVFPDAWQLADSLH